MNEIERLISRHLDGELTPAEQLRLHKILAESPDARVLLREMTVLGRAARRTPSLHPAGRGMEDRLFTRLRAEGYRPGASVPQASVAVKTATSDLIYTRLRQVALVAAMLIAIIGGGYLLDDHVVVRTPLAGDPRTTTAATPFTVPQNESVTAAPDAIAQGTAAGRVVRAGRGNAIMRRRSVQPTISITPATPDHGDRYLSARVIGTQDTAASSSLPDVPVNSDPIQPPAVPLFPDTPRLLAGSGTGRQWMASIRGGVASVGSSKERAQELNMRIAMQVDGGHQIALLVGSGPAVAETRHENTGIGMSVPAPPPPPGGRPIGRVMPREDVLPLPNYEFTLRSEAWFGLGYNYSIAMTDDLSLEPGLRAGVGSTTWRMGVELPLRYRMNESMSMECALSATRVQPRDGTPDRFTQLNESDHFIYEGSMLQPSFNSVAFQLGVRVDLAGNK